MKKIMAISAVMLLSQASFASMSYECWRYVSGSPEGYVKVSADSKSDAESKARAKFNKLNSKYDYVQCK